MFPYRWWEGIRKYKVTWTKIEDLKHFELNTLPVYHDRYIKTKIRTYGDKVCANFRGVNAPEDDIECESFTVISINFLIVYKSKYIPASVFRQMCF